MLPIARTGEVTSVSRRVHNALSGTASLNRDDIILVDTEP